MNTYYRKSSLGEWLRYFRINSRDSSIGSQTSLAEKLFLDQKQISNIERGETRPELETIAQWCRVTRWDEGWDIIAHMYELDQFSIPPIHPELSDTLSNAILMIERTMEEASRSLEVIKNAQIQRRPGKDFECDAEFDEALISIMSLIPDTKSFMLSANRDIGIDISDRSKQWISKSVADRKVMPNLHQLEEREQIT